MDFSEEAPFPKDPFFWTRPGAPKSRKRSRKRVKIDCFAIILTLFRLRSRLFGGGGSAASAPFRGGRGSGGVKSAGVCQSVRETGRDESQLQSVPSPENSSQKGIWSSQFLRDLSQVVCCTLRDTPVLTRGRFFFRPEIGQFSPYFAAISLLNYRVNMEKREKSHWWFSNYPVETATRNCRFLSLVVVECVLNMIRLGNPQGTFRTKNTTAPKSVVFCYRRSFSLSVPFACLFVLKKQAFPSTLCTVFLSS